MVTSEADVGEVRYAERRIRRDVYSLRARDYPGREPAFVLMHGFPDNLQIYDALAPMLATARRRVVVFDFLGYGGSDKPLDYEYSPDKLEGDLSAVVQAVDLAAIVPVAHDASGPTAINWALSHPKAVVGLALLNTYYGAAPSLRFPEFISLFADPAYTALASAFAQDPKMFGWLLAFQASQFQKDAPEWLRARAQQMLVPIITNQFITPPSSVPAFAALTRDLYATVEANTRRAEQLHSFRRPVTVVWGAGDPYLNEGVGRHLHQQFSNAALHLLPAGHWPQIDAPEAVAHALLDLSTEG